jgi:hypothetical protein
VNVLRSSIWPLQECAGRAFIQLKLSTQDDSGLPHYGLQLRVVAGSMPFVVPSFPLLLHTNGMVQGTWTEPISPAQGSFEATLVATLIGPSGDEGIPFEFHVKDEGRLLALAWMKGWIWLAFGLLVLVSVVYGLPRALRARSTFRS